MPGVPDINAAVLGEAVTKSDSTVLKPTRALWVGGSGNLAVRFVNAPSTTITLTGVAAGTLLPISVVQVMDATTATSMTALY